LGDAAPNGGFFQEALYLLLHLAGAGDVSGLDELLKFDDLQVQNILVVLNGQAFDPFQQSQAFHIKPLVIEDAGKVQLLAYLDVDLLVDGRQAQAGQQLFEQVALEIGQFAFGGLAGEFLQ
jgi:hypothetical protein